MNLYKVNKGQKKIKGPQWQPALIQYGLGIFGTILACFLGSLLVGFITLVLLIAMNAYVANIIESDSARVYFFPNCTRPMEDLYHINRLYGFAEGVPKWNSVTIGWRCTNNKYIEIVAECYINGQRVIKPMIKTKAQVWVFMNIQNKIGKYVLKAMTPKGQSITISVEKPKKISFYSFFKLFIYKLNPLFGGKNPAPNEMKFYMTKLVLK